MFYFLSKAIDFLIMPLSIVFFILIYSFLTKSNRRRKLALGFGIASLALASNSYLVTKAINAWEPKFVNLAEVKKTYDVGILLSGGLITMSTPRQDHPAMGNHGDRLLQTYLLYKHGKIRKILITGTSGEMQMTRKVGETLLALLGRTVSPSVVSQVAKTLDAAVAAFHRRPLSNRYQALMLDGVVLARKTGAGALRRPVLVALGLRPDGRKEIIDFRLAGSESAAEWERFLTDLHHRGLTGQGLDMICVDGGKGLLAALPIVLPQIPVQRCWAHKIRNVLDKVRKADQPKVKRALHKIMHAANVPQARSAARRLADRFQAQYPAAVACLRDDLDELLTCFRYKTQADRRAVRTTNAIERRFREVRRRTRPMGTFQDKTSMDRILFAVFTHENKSQGISTPFLLTHNN